LDGQLKVRRHCCRRKQIVEISQFLAEEPLLLPRRDANWFAQQIFYGAVRSSFLDRRTVSLNNQNACRFDWPVISESDTVLADF
jgi:hypothetical protein